MAIKPTPAKPTVTKTAPKQVVDHSPIFGRTNLILMVVGALVIASGMLLMGGGKSTDPKVFDYKEVYSTTRITLAPILIVIGLAIEVVAIFKKQS